MLTFVAAWTKVRRLAGRDPPVSFLRIKERGQQINPLLPSYNKNSLNFVRSLRPEGRQPLACSRQYSFIKQFRYQTSLVIMKVGSRRNDSYFGRSRSVS